MSFKVTVNPLCRTYLTAGLLAALAMLSPVAYAGDGDEAPTALALNPCSISGPTVAECGTLIVFTATASASYGPFNATWLIQNNTAGASIVGATTCTNVFSCPVTLTTSNPGSATLRVFLHYPGGVTKNCAVTFTVVDTTPPTITCPPPAVVACGSSLDPSVTGNPVAADACGPVTVTFSDQVTGQNCAGPIITRTWTATDQVGLTASCTQTISFFSTVTITCPDPITIQCFSQLPPPDINSVVATSSCQLPLFVHHVGDSATSGASNCNNVITRQYRAVDPCGVEAVCNQLITVDDTTPPSLQCPAPLNFQCFSQVPAPDATQVVATDNCGGFVQVTHLGDSASNGQSSCNNTITRTYQGVDSCGNTGTCTQIITVNDTTPPSLTCPAPISVQCFTQIPPALPILVTATDNCGGFVSVFHQGDAPSNGTSNCNNVVTRTYLGVDQCGNTATCTQLITVNDTTPPSITCPAPLNLQCFSQVPAPNVGSVAASDNCGGFVNVTHVGDVATNGQSSCNNVITRTYQATDSCNNSTTCTQTITVNDTTPPTIQCPAGATLQCFSQIPAPSITAVIATDNCVPPVVSHVGDVATNGQSSCNNTITRTYQAVDSCGNTATCTQVFTVNDTTPPIITCPGPVTVQCFSQVPPPNTQSVIASDNCGGVTVIHVGDVQTNPGSSCNNVITRTYQATDLCNNTATCTQTITVNDNTPPIILCPATVNVQCFSQVPVASTTAVSASDNCGPVNVIHVGDVQSNPGSSCNNTITRTYQATDQCGNTASCTQTINVNDTTPPVIVCPPGQSFECFSSIPLPNPALVVATDSCGPVTPVFVGDVATNGTSSCNNQITRTYSATDTCGNTATCTQVFTINDVTPPVIMCPPDFTLVCGQPFDPTVTGTPTVTDNCNPAPVVTSSDVITGTCPMPGQTVTRTWTANDGCNIATCVQIITLLPPPPITPPCSTDLGGGCGAPAPALAGGINGAFITLDIQLATPNSPGLLAVQLAPYSPPSPLAPPCVLHLDPNSPQTFLVANIQTDFLGNWTATYPQPLAVVDAKLQAAILAQGGPLGFAQLTNGLRVQRPCPPCTYTLQLWAANTGPSADNYANNWLTVFPGGMGVGNYFPANGNSFPNGFQWTGNAAGRTALKSFLQGFPGILPGVIQQDAQNPVVTFGSGGLSRMLAVLQLNLAFNAAGFLGSSNPPLSSFVYSNPGDSLHGFTMGQILTLGNSIAAGTTPPPAGYTILSFTDLLEEFQGAYLDCTPSQFAIDHLVAPAP
jgi:hypothetical protein